MPDTIPEAESSGSSGSGSKKTRMAKAMKISADVESSDSDCEINKIKESLSELKEDSKILNSQLSKSQINKKDNSEEILIILDKTEEHIPELYNSKI